MDLVRLPGHLRRQRNGQQRLQAHALPTGEFLLHSLDVDIVVVHGVQGGGGGRGYPGGGGAGAGLCDLLLHHGRHQISHRPHPLADLCSAGESGRQTDIDVAILVGQDPRLGFHRALADHRAGLHRGVDLIAGAVEKTGVDERDPVRGSGNAGLEVGRSAALLVHDADFYGVGGQTQHVLDTAEQLDGERDFLGPVHLRLDDVDRTGPAVAMRPVGIPGGQTVHGDQAGEHTVLDSFKDLFFFPVDVDPDDGVVGHQMPDIADEQQAPAGQGDIGPVRRPV